MKSNTNWAFVLTEAEQASLRKFHKKQKSGALQVKFTNTEIGSVVKVKMTDQKKWVDITDYRSW